MSRHEWGPFPKPKPSVRLTGAAVAGMSIGIVLGAYHRPWSVTLACGGAGAILGVLSMTVRLAREAKHRRTYRRVVPEPRVSNVIWVDKDTA